MSFCWFCHVAVHTISLIMTVLPKAQAGNEPRHDKTNQSDCAPSEDSDQPGHQPSLIRIFAVHSVGS